jgi:transglutaminase-like putative cysteine protease
MHFRIDHSTRYRFARPVSLGPHELRLRPRPEPHLRLARAELRVHPHPSVRSESIDLEGNHITLLCFDQPVQTLSIASSVEGSVRRPNPFDYVVTQPDALRLPALFDDASGVLAAYVRRRDRHNAIIHFATAVARAAHGATVPFLAELARRLATFTPEHRELGIPRPAQDTLTRRAGTCRDLAVLFIEACRAQHLPARFVSGYWHNHRREPRRELHAWAEVYLPGAGWRGYDPITGLALTDDYVALAASADPAASAPVSGTHDGLPAEVTLEWDIRMQIR